MLERQEPLFDVPPDRDPPPEFNLRAVTAELAETIHREVFTLLGEASEDLQTIGAEIAPILVTAVATGDVELTEELKAQLRMIADIHNIRASKAKWRAILAVSATAVRALSLGLHNLLPNPEEGGDAS